MRARTSLARSRARSGVMKQASPLSARLASYWLVLEMSWDERGVGCVWCVRVRVCVRGVCVCVCVCVCQEVVHTVYTHGFAKTV